DHPPLPPPPPHHPPRRYAARLGGDALGRDDGGGPGHGDGAGGDGAAMQRVVEEEARDAARRVREIELVCAVTADDAAVRDRRRRREIDIERLGDRKRVVGEELAAQLVARKGVAIDQRDGEAACGEQRGQRGAGRSGADDRNVYRFHNRIPNRYGKAFTTSFRAAATLLAI